MENNNKMYEMACELMRAFQEAGSNPEERAKCLRMLEYTHHLVSLRDEKE